MANTKIQHNYTDEDTWMDEYKPVKNPIDRNAAWNGCMFETYGKEDVYVREMAQKEPNRVWTILDCEGMLCITNGWHYVNRMGYLITEKPFKDDDDFNIYDSDDIKKLLRREARERSKLKKTEAMKHKPIHETIADIAYLAGQFGYYSGNSRADMLKFIFLAGEFEKLYKGTDWNAEASEDSLDYMDEVENFAKSRLGLKKKLDLNYPEAFRSKWDNIEIERVRDDAEDGTYPVHDDEDVEPNDFYSVYVHMVKGGVMCVADVPTAEDATALAETLRQAVMTYKDNGYLNESFK